LFSGLPGLAELVVTDSLSSKLHDFRERLLGHLFRRRVRNYDSGLFEIIDLADLRTLLDGLEAGLLSAQSREDRCRVCREFCSGIFDRPASECGASCWAEKTPRNLLFASVILEIYPGARFINVVRDGRDVVSSIIERKFWPIARSPHYPQTKPFCGEQTFDKVVHYWSTLIDIGRQQEERIGATRWLNVRYEDLLDDLELSFDRVFNFLGLDNSKETLDSIRSLIEPKSTNLGRWKKNLTPAQVDSFLEISGPNLARFGYL
jgi:hypothetical protein